MTLMTQGDPKRIAADLTSEIYACLLGSSGWQTFLDNLSRTLPNGKVSLFYHDVASRVGALTLHSQFEPERIAAYKEYYCRLNPWMEKANNRPLDLGVRAEQMLPRRELVRTEFYADFLRPQGLDSAVGVTVFRDHGCNFMLSILHGSPDEAKAQSAAMLLGTLAPHLRQAFTYYRRAGAVTNASAIVGAASDALGVGIVTVGIDRRVRWANPGVHGLLDSGDPIGVDSRGRVTASRPDVREALDQAFGAGLRGETAGKRTLDVPARGDTRLHTRLTIVVPTLSPCEEYFAGPCVILLIEGSVARGVLTAERLRCTFSLTPAEARLACAIAAGATLADAAAGQGITRETARTQLKRIFVKMDVHRQAELVAKVHRLHSGSG
jgi:DNA-binding CsgD family transcriptional regulator